MKKVHEMKKNISGLNFASTPRRGLVQNPSSESNRELLENEARKFYAISHSRQAKVNTKMTCLTPQKITQIMKRTPQSI